MRQQAVLVGQVCPMGVRVTEAEAEAATAPRAHWEAPAHRRAAAVSRARSGVWTEPRLAPSTDVCFARARAVAMEAQALPRPEEEAEVAEEAEGWVWVWVWAEVVVEYMEVVVLVIIVVLV